MMLRIFLVLCFMTFIFMINTSSCPKRLGDGSSRGSFGRRRGSSSQVQEYGIRELAETFDDPEIKEKYFGSNVSDKYKASKFQETDNIIYCTDSKKNEAISIWAHIRNSFAHGLFEVERVDGGYYFILSDKHQGTDTMKAQIQVDKFEPFINELYKQINKQLTAMAKVADDPIFKDLDPQSKIIKLEQLSVNNKQKDYQKMIDALSKRIKDGKCSEDLAFVSLVKLVQDYLQKISDQKEFKDSKDEKMKDNVKRMRSVIGLIDKRRERHKEFDVNFSLFEELLSEIYASVDGLLNMDKKKQPKTKSKTEKLPKNN